MTFRRKIAICTALALAPCGFVINAHAAENQTVAPKTTALHVLSYETLGIGTQSGCTRRALFSINDEAEWKRVWGVHSKPLDEAPPPPKVDFERQSVIAVLTGERSDGKSLQIAQIVRAPRETIVYFWLVADDWQNTLAEKNAPSQPYLFVAIDKTEAPLRFVNALAADSCTRCAG